MDTRFPGTVTSWRGNLPVWFGVQRRYTLFHSRFLTIPIAVPALADH